MLAPTRGIPLRVKLVAAVLALVTVALLIIGAASSYFLRAYLMDQIDGNLGSLNVAAQGAAGRPEPGLLTSDEAFAFQALPSGIRDLGQTTLTAAERPDLPDSFAAFHEAMDAHGEHPYTIRSVDSPTRWRVLLSPGPSDTVVAVGLDLADVDHTVKQLLWIDGLAGAGVLLMLASVGAAVVRSNLKPLRQIERTTVAIAAGDLSQRVPDPEPGAAEPRTELGRLSRALNTMLTQIESAFRARAESETAARDAAIAAQASEARALRSEERMRQFVADASHELRTPLTTIRGFAELYRQGATGSPEETARLVRRIEDEAARMGLLVQDLLLLARLDRERPLSLHPIELPVLASEAVQAAQAMAPDRQIVLEIAREAGPLVVMGDDARLRQVLGNLLTNAITHTPVDASVMLRLRSEPGTAVIEVADTGQGLSAEQAERVFERFYRADASRTRRDRDATSTGLGLAIVAALVAAHAGTVEVETAPGAGSTFRVRLPLAPSTGDDDHGPDDGTGGGPADGSTAGGSDAGGSDAGGSDAGSGGAPEAGAAPAQNDGGPGGADGADRPGGNAQGEQGGSDGHATPLTDNAQSGFRPIAER